MKITCGPVKNAQNIADRGLPFGRAVDFDFSTARTWQDTRKSYPEVRFVAIGYLGDRLHVLCLTETATGIRVISFRKANQREGVKHGFTLTRN
ncbi:MAG: BrnT family toxin [Nitrosomonadales bacterium]|nr:BrnT family toxin [Nitrosomonadales bacterium]